MLLISKGQRLGILLNTYNAQNGPHRTTYSTQNSSSTDVENSVLAEFL